MREREVPAGTRIGGYVITGVIGMGASAVVYVAEDEERGQRVALKVLAPELAADGRVRDLLMGEGRRAASIQHPHVITPTACGEVDGYTYLASRLVEGCDLRRVVAVEGGRLDPWRTCAILAQVASALDAAHANGLVHRDVKPANVLVERVGDSERALVCDFGLARDAAEGGLTGTEGLVGTVAYVSPEQIRGDPVDGRADQYSLACVMFACLAGRPPFVRESDLGVVYAHLEEQPPRLSTLREDLPAAVDDALARGLAKDPGARFASCMELVRSVEAALTATARSRRARGRTFVFVAVAALLAVVLAALSVVVFGSGSTSLRPGEVGVLDPRTGSVHSIWAGGFVSDITHAPGDLLLALEPFDRRLLVLDPYRRRVVRNFSIGVDPGGAPAFAAGRIWISDPDHRALLRIQPESGALVRVPLPTSGLTDPSQAGNVIFDDSSLWLADGMSMLERVDPINGRVIARIPIPAAQYTVAGDGQLWVLSPDLGSVFRIDPATNHVIARADIHPGLNAGAIAGGYLWVTLGVDGNVWKIAPDGSVVTAVAVGGDPQLVAASGTSVWETNDTSDSITKIDATTDATQTYHFGVIPSAVSVAGSNVLFSTVLSASAAALPRSGPRVIRILLDRDWIPNADPALPGSPSLAQLFDATCAKLYNYPDAGGAAGGRLVPEVATGAPRVSDGGRTYRIDVRSGFRFSPPSGEAVDARTFAYVLERDLAPAMRSDYAARVFHDIVGAGAYHAGIRKQLRGVSASATTLTVHLVRPSADLVPRLATQLGCAVPKGTPALNTPNGIGPIPMAGPYYLASWEPGVSAIVRRNPNYAGTRPHHLDAIVYELNVPTGDAIDAVAKGSADLFPDFSPFPYPQELMPGGSPPARTHLYRPVSMESRFLLVNARQGPFRDPRLRRAVSLALDRRTLAALWASQPAQHVIQPPLQGSAATDSAPAPDVAAARRLVAGRRVHATLVTCRIPAPTCEQTAELVQTQLGQIGIDVTVQLEDDPQPGAHADPLLATWLPDWADPEAALWPLLPHLGAPGTFGTPGISPRLEELARLAAARRVAGLERLARSLERDGEIDVYARTSYVELTSARLGCVVHNPLFPLADLAALCVGR